MSCGLSNCCARRCSRRASENRRQPFLQPAIAARCRWDALNPLPMISYLSKLKTGKIVLWCYLIWYLSTVYFHFDPSLRIWLNAAGISVVIGIGLILSVSGPAGTRPDFWQSFRLFMMPFAVASFSSLIKGKGFVLVFPPRLDELLMSAGLCLAFVLLALFARFISATRPQA